MIPYVPRPGKTVYHQRDANMSASSNLRVFPADMDIKPRNYEIPELRLTNKVVFELEVKKIVRSELRQHVRGMGRMLNDNESNKFKKCFWFFATVTCLTVAAYFLGKQIHELLQENTILKSSLEQSAKIKLPALTLCPGIPALTNFHAKNFVKQKCALKDIGDEKCEMTSFGVLGTNVSDVWEVVGTDGSKIHVSAQCPYHLDGAHNCDVLKETSYFDSFWGKCVVVSPKDKEHFYQGPHNYYNLTIEDSEGEDSILINIYLHYEFNGEDTQNHLSYFRSYALRRNDYISISVEPKEFKMLSKDLKNCTDTPEDINCEDTCLDEKLSNVVKCRLPFMQSTKHPFCDTFHDALTAMRDANRFYRNVSKITCSKCGNRCKKIVFTLGVNNVAPTYQNNTQLMFYYQDNTFETVVQTREYTFDKFLSDAGGILGFFLGFSVLGVLEMIQQLIYCCRKRKC